MAPLFDAGFDGHPVDLWVVGGSQFVDCATRISRSGRWPNLKMLVLGGTYNSTNISSSIVSSSELRFMQGYLCALASTTNTVGFVATAPRTNNAIFRGIAAFAIGARAAKPDIRIATALTSSFESPIAGRKATIQLIEEANADCIATQLNDLTVSVWASSYNRFSLGFGTDARFFVDENVLLSLLYNWTVAVSPYYKAVLNDSWSSAPPVLYTNYETGGLTLSGYSTLVHNDWRREVDTVQQGIQNGSLSVYCLPLWNDTQFVNSTTLYNTSTGQQCMNNTYVMKMVGIPQMVDLLVEYSARNSPYRYVWVKETYSGSIAIYVITTLLLMWAVGVGIHILRYREHQVYRSSSPTFLFLMLIGVMLIIGSIYFRIGRRTIVSCMAPWWFFGVGFSLVFSCVCAKNWRVWKIFAGRRLKNKGILDMHLILRWVMSYVVLEVIMLTIWTVVDPLLPTYSRSPLLDYDEVQIDCESTHGLTLFICFCVFNLLLLVPVGVVAYLSRKAKGDYDEAKPMGVMLYATIIIEVVFFLVAFGVSPQYEITFYLYFGAAWLPSAVILALYFTPKLLRLRLATSARTPSDDAVDLSGLKSFNSEMTGGLRSLRSRQAGQSLRTPTDSLADRGVDVAPHHGGPN